MLNLHKLAKRKSTSKKKKIFSFLFFGHTQHVLSQFPDQASHPCPVQWKLSLDHWGSPINFIFREGFFPRAQQERRKGGVMVKGNVKLLKSSVLLLFFPTSQDWGLAALHSLLLLQRRRLGLRSQDTWAERLSSRKTYPPLLHYFSHEPPNLQHLGHLWACRQEAQPSSARSSTLRVSEQFSKPWHEKSKTQVWRKHRVG